MQRFKMLGGLVCLAAASLLLSAAPLSNQVTGLDLANFDGRDVLVIRTTGDVPVPGSYSRDKEHATVSFKLPGVGADSASGLSGEGLIKGVSISKGDGSGSEFTVKLAGSELAEQSHLRFSQPSDHVVLLEVFPAAASKNGVAPITDIHQQLGIDPNKTAPHESSGSAASAPQDTDIDDLGIPTLDLTNADPQRVLSLAAATGLLDITATARVATENLGELTVAPAGQSLSNWCELSPPGELVLSGTQSEIANFMQLADKNHLAAEPTFTQYWAENKPRPKVRPATSGGYSATRQRVKDDPYAGIYHTDTLKQSRLLSDVRVSLPAINGMNLYDVLNYLSLISGISLIIDPYTFDEPTGMRRDPKVPEPPNPTPNQPGFRPASVFQPQTPGAGTVIGNFDNVPFDTALELILETHGLRYVVYGGGGDAQRYGKSSGSGNEAYSKPVVLVTSRERLEQEIKGTNQIDLYQFHYADPYQITDLLNNLNMLPGEDSGWYIYEGSGYGYTGGAGGGYGNSGGGGQGGQGGRGGGGGGRGGNRYGASPRVLVYRGSDRTMVHEAVAQAAQEGENLVRVLLPHESGNQLVTIFAH